MAIRRYPYLSEPFAGATVIQPVSTTTAVAGSSILAAHADHEHPMPTGTDPHAQTHTDADHSGANKVQGLENGVSRGTRKTLNFIGATIADNAGSDRLDITIGTTGSITAKSADTTRASTSTLTDDPHLASISLTTNTTYFIEAYLLHSSPTTADIKFSLAATNTPGGGWSSTGVSGNVAYNQATSASGDLKAWSGTPTVSHGGAGAGLYAMTKLEGFAIVGTASALTLKWAQDTLDAGNTVLYKGSFIRATPVA